MKQGIITVFTAVSLMSCGIVETLDPRPQEWSHTIKDCGKSDYFTISNKGEAASVTFEIQGNLSHDAKILWSDQSPDSDTVFVNSNEILLSKGEVNIKDHRSDYYSNKLYVKYVSLNDSTAGNLRIKIKI